MEQRGWSYYSWEEKNIYYNQSGASIKFLEVDKDAKCLGYDHVDHRLEYWEYQSEKGTKKRIEIVYLPEENVFMPYLRCVESSDGGFNFATLDSYNKAWYRNINFLRHAQYIHQNNLMINLNPFVELFEEIYSKYIENEMVEEEDGFSYANGVVYLGPDKVSYYFRETTEFVTDGTLGNI